MNSKKISILSKGFRDYITLKTKKDTALQEEIRWLKTNDNFLFDKSVEAVEYSAVAGETAVALADSGVCSSIISTDDETSSYINKKLENSKQKNISLFREHVDLGGGFYGSPSNGGKWKTIFLNDVLPFMSYDSDLVCVLISLKTIITHDGLVVFRLYKPSWFQSDVVVEQRKQKHLFVLEYDRIRHRNFDLKFSYSCGKTRCRDNIMLTAWEKNDVITCIKSIKGWYIDKKTLQNNEDFVCCRPVKC